MKPLFECVPNISEGQDHKKIEEIAQAADSVDGAKVLHVDRGAAANRSVITIIGTAQGIEEGAFQLIRKASELIDMRTHQGAHPRLGAVDVCPFVPLENTSLTDCAEISRRLGARVGDQLGIPVYLYADAAANPTRKNLASIRKGQYEGLKEKLNDPDWEPDFGGRSWNPKSGVVTIGARSFLIAYNVNLATKNEKIATKIARRVRESGWRGYPGLLKDCKAIGWYLDDHQCAQVSMNLTDFRTTNLHHAFEACRELAREYGTEVNGSEIVGLVPRDAFLSSANYFASAGECSEVEKMDKLVQTLGLQNFKHQDRLLENLYERPNRL